MKTHYRIIKTTRESRQLDSDNMLLNFNWIMQKLRLSHFQVALGQFNSMQSFSLEAQTS